MATAYVPPQLSHFVDDDHAQVVGAVFGAMEGSSLISDAYLRIDGDGNFVNEMCVLFQGKSYRIRVDLDPSNG